MIRFRVEAHPEIPGWHRITIDAPFTEPLADYEGGNACEALLQFCLKYVRDNTGESSFRPSCPKGWHHEETDTQTNVTYFRRGSMKVGVSVKSGLLMVSVSDRKGRATISDIERVKRDFLPEGSVAVVAESPNRTRVRFICVAMPGFQLDTSRDFPVAVPVSDA